LGTAALAVAALALDSGRLPLLFAAGALADLSYWTRLEGAVLGTALAISLLAGMRQSRQTRTLLRMAVYTAGAVVAIPYLLYLHGALGRWAISGRVQAAAAVEAAPAPAGRASEAPAPG